MKQLYKLSILISFLLFTTQLFSQQQKTVPLTTISVNPATDTAKQRTAKQIEDDKKRDMNDVIAKFLHHRTLKKIDSVTSKPSFSLVPAIGYTLVSKFAVVLSGNAAFRTGPESRISEVVASTSVTQNRQFTLPVQTSIWTKDNKYNFVGVYRFFKYPQSTFGLGSSSDITHEDPMDYYYIEFYETVLRHITGNIYAGAGYIIDNRWNVSDRGNFKDYANYGESSHSVASGFTLNALLDSRDNAINPFKGAYVSLQYRSNYDFLGSTTDWSSLVVDVRKYIRFPAGSDNVLALWSYDWVILHGRPAYLDLPSTQWDASSATGRGYIQGRFRGAQMVYAESEYRFKITGNGLIGGVFFLNGESLSAAPGTRLQAIQPGYGPGLRVKLNKVSNTNISIDYGFGRQGSNGLFIDVGEIF